MKYCNFAKFNRILDTKKVQVGNDQEKVRKTEVGKN